MNVLELRKHLRTCTAAFGVTRKSKAVAWGDEDLHRTTFHADPELYALTALDRDVLSSQQMRVLYLLLADRQAKRPANVAAVLERTAAVLAAILPADDVLTVALALRKNRVNSKAVRRFLLQYLLRHPNLEELASRRPSAVVDCLEHAAGRNVVRGCVARLRRGMDNDPYVRQNLVRYAGDGIQAAAVLKRLYRIETRERTISRPLRDAEHRRSRLAEPTSPLPKTITAANRGNIAAALVHYYRGGPTRELLPAIGRYAKAAAERLPRFDGRISVVLDASASTRGYGEREYCCVSQSVALSLVLKECCANLVIHLVGGDGYPPRPAGGTDLAAALLDALADAPDVVAIISDGYENVHAGDLARVVAALPAAGQNTPIVFCHSKFTQKDDLTLRRPAAAVAEIDFWHERDFSEVLATIALAARGAVGRDFWLDWMNSGLQRLETEATPWTNSN
jgi:hypothetical protein